MTRKELVKILNEQNDKTVRLTDEKIYSIIFDYCIEQGKKKADTYMLLTILQQRRLDMQKLKLELLQYVIKMYTKKYHICFLRRIIPNTQQTETVLTY